MLTTQELVRLLRRADKSVTEWRIRGLVRRQLIATPRCIGGTWVWSEADVDAVRAALGLKVPAAPAESSR